MTDHSRVAQEIESIFTSLDYPEDFLATYDQMECLTSRKGCEAFLVRCRETGALAIAKCYLKSDYDLSSMVEHLRTLDHPGIPKYIGSFENEAMLCLIREYVEGVTISEYVRMNELTQREVIARCLSLAEILIYLHEREKPVIHRDIKPENIIVKPDGTLVLIDFDIARVVKADRETDTMFFGTRGYAPPEQYGFTQTDCRADIYAFGILLRFLLTNSDRPGKNVYLLPELQRIINKCTAFSPKDRYGSMIAVKRALMRVRSRKLPDRRRWLAVSTVAAVLALCVGFALGRYTPLFELNLSSQFQEPLMEAAVRAQLGVDEQTELTDEMLAQVRRIFIHGVDTFADPDLYHARMIDDSTRGSIRSLADVALLPNLEELKITYQGQMDISAIAQGQNLRSVELKHVRLSDVSPLGALPELDQVVLFDSGITDASPLQSDVWLKGLDVGMTRIASLEQVGVYPQLTSLSLKYLTLDTLVGIEKMPKLQTVMLNGARVRDLSALLLLPELERVFVQSDTYEEVSAFFAGTDVQVLIE